jgi:hypothetical protein
MTREIARLSALARLQDYRDPRPRKPKVTPGRDLNQSAELVA